MNLFPSFFNYPEVRKSMWRGGLLTGFIAYAFGMLYFPVTAFIQNISWTPVISFGWIVTFAFMGAAGIGFLKYRRVRAETLHSERFLEVRRRKEARRRALAGDQSRVEGVARFAAPGMSGVADTMNRELEG